MPSNLSATDPATHVAFVVNGVMPGHRIGPVMETERYVAKIMATRGRDLDEHGKALLREDLASPCTEEVAVFHAFTNLAAASIISKIVEIRIDTGSCRDYTYFHESRKSGQAT